MAEYPIMQTADEVDELLKARAEIDEQLRRHKNAFTLLFAEVVGPTASAPQTGDPSGPVMLHGHDELATRAIEEHLGRVATSDGDSAMAEFPDPASAVRAAIEIERQFQNLNSTLPEDQRVDVRIGVHSGEGFRKGNDLYGDVVNVTARIVKRSAPAQILVSRAVHEAVAGVSGLYCRWLSKVTIEGRTETEDLYEVVWTDLEASGDGQERIASFSYIPPRYEVLGQIGTGGTGIVYKVSDLETGEIVALKILKPEIASDPDVQEALKREMCLARKITHKNVCRIHEFSRFNGTGYTSMEFVEGESLSSKLSRSGALPLMEALDIARQICAGLREAHAQGIVHRDLKPGNIMLDLSGTAKVMDFGIARMIQRDGPMTGTIVGTPAYMAPEQAELKPVSQCTDIYALGLVLYEMLAGVKAFEGETPVAVAVKQIREYPKRPREIVPEITRAMEAVVMKCLQKDPARRYASVDKLEMALLKAAKVRRATPWEATLERHLERAESEIREFLQRATARTKTFVERQEWRNVLRLRDDPKAMLGVTGMVSALAIFLLFGAGKPRTANARALVAANQNSLASAAAPSASFANSRPLVSQRPPEPIGSHDVDLYGNSQAEHAKAATPNAETPKNVTPSAPAVPPPVSNRLAEAAAPAKPSMPQVEPKSRKLVSSPSPHMALASTAPQDSVDPAAAKSATVDAFTSPSQPAAAPKSLAEQLVEEANAAGKPLSTGGDPAEAKMFLEAGAFKNESEATHAVDELTQLGFHAVQVHKGKLWSQSYRVEVGPYTSQSEVSNAEQSLSSHGFKSHVAN
jgi:class 3 adenylate cyclase/cell division protein FtsN